VDIRPVKGLGFSAKVKFGKKRLRGSGGLMDERATSFGPFRLLPAQRLLLEGDQPVRLGSRAFDILATLLERRVR
jgi:DNA-binding response OmpR family regulator